ncbi:MAG: iron-sulfur cluster insertion protein ErpA [Micavibrio aeruginosavorus]|uniref:Iron-sulfur cluster insertion protein ErpA n=1 Tax=Micavibrio aeruginosavorus TaxID=349221 RepID=A0A2W5A3V6_9BACT|nr:MAG: iron-sulfur cluster insertion protein ErpA [Micavibrio aeruginosavorus]
MSTITLTDGLVKQIKTLREKDGNPRLNLRITVDSGGCQGFEYKFELTETVNADDETFEKDGIAVIIDDISLPYMRGCTIDYVSDLIGAYFKIDNPNAKSACGCGTSFAV